MQFILTREQHDQLVSSWKLSHALKEKLNIDDHLIYLVLRPALDDINKKIEAGFSPSRRPHVKINDPYHSVISSIDKIIRLINTYLYGPRNAYFYDRQDWLAIILRSLNLSEEQKLQLKATLQSLKEQIQQGAWNA